MIGLYFRDAVSRAAISLALAMLAFIMLAVTRGAKVSRRGRLIALFVVQGLTVELFHRAYLPGIAA